MRTPRQVRQRAQLVILVSVLAVGAALVVGAIELWRFIDGFDELDLHAGDEMKSLPILFGCLIVVLAGTTAIVPRLGAAGLMTGAAVEGKSFWDYHRRWLVPTAWGFIVVGVGVLGYGIFCFVQPFFEPMSTEGMSRESVREDSRDGFRSMLFIWAGMIATSIGVSLRKRLADKTHH